jgi:hypothetical protein
MDICCVAPRHLAPYELCRCGSWDVTAIWAHMICDAHHCKRCGRAWSVGEEIEFEARHLKWAHLPATGAAEYSRQQRLARQTGTTSGISPNKAQGGEDDL